MKKTRLILSATLFISMLSFALFSSCDKDTNCYLEVKVYDSMTKIPIPNAEVEIYQNGGTVYALGYTDGGGKFATHFVAPAIVEIRAKLDIYSDTIRIGERRATGSVRLAEGETKVAQLAMTDQIFYE